MKVKTNLSADELVLVSKGLKALADNSQKDGKFIPSNEAEKELLSLARGSLDTMLESLTEEVKDLFNE